LAQCRGNVGFGLTIKGVDGKTKKEAVDEVLEIVGLNDFRRYYPNELSASMLQRVVIARLLPPSRNCS
jgi:sulfonate transport system ATP-binding protein